MDRLEMLSKNKTASLMVLMISLNSKDREFAINFISENRHLNSDEYAVKVRNLFLDKPKPKKYLVIDELLMYFK